MCCAILTFYNGVVHPRIILFSMRYAQSCTVSRLTRVSGEVFGLRPTSLHASRCTKLPTIGCPPLAAPGATPLTPHTGARQAICVLPAKFLHMNESQWFIHVASNRPTYSLSCQSGARARQTG